MSWSGFVNQLLRTSSKVDKAAVFDSSGQPLAVSKGLQVSQRDGCAIFRCIMDPACSLTSINIEDTDFRCFQGSNTTLVGMATNGSGRVMVARYVEEAVVVVMGKSAPQGSFLFEIQHNLLERTRQHDTALQRPLSGEETKSEQPRKKLIVPPPSAISQDDVLLDVQQD